MRKQLHKIHILITKNKLLNNTYFTRIVKILFFLGINSILFPYFLQTNRVDLSPKLTKLLHSIGISDPKQMFPVLNIDDATNSASLDPEVILEKLNEERVKKALPEFKYSDKLATAAAVLLFEAEKLNYDLADQDFTPELRKVLQDVKYEYLHVSHNMVVGPKLEAAVIDAWYSQEEQVRALFEDDFTEVGFATTFADIEGEGRYGVIVQILAKPNDQKVSAPQVKTQTTSSPPLKFPKITNEEVFAALNTYRQTHGRVPVSEHPNLCEYAQKRVGDLIAFGGLDAHAGFAKDFEDLNNLPQPIKEYPGSSIAENLAYQYCKNMTTNDSFIAQTGTALIEWCFDSSTAGHREAQLSPKYSKACVRSGNNMFVVIFGD